MNEEFNFVTVKAKAPLVYQPELWNTPGIIENTRCYTYVIDEPALGAPWLGGRTQRSERFYQELRKKGSFPARDAVQRLLSKPFKLSATGAQSQHQIDVLLHHDGWERIRKHAFDPAKNHIIAYSNYLKHCYRQDSNRIWSHKWGTKSVSNKDRIGNLLEDLEAPGIVLDFEPEEPIDISYYRMRPGQAFVWHVPPPL